MANGEDACTGAFGEGRLLFRGFAPTSLRGACGRSSQAAGLACGSFEESDHTSIAARISVRQDFRKVEALSN